jgi:NAD(P)H-dependent flavin oxidoreductase YrpB (nitropropane dioxygenase family)
MADQLYLNRTFVSLPAANQTARQVNMIQQFRQLGIEVPIFAFSHCRDVVVAVSKAGGLGVYGAALHSDEQIEIDLAWIEQQLPGKPYGIDLLMPGKYAGADEGGQSADAQKAAIPPVYDEYLDKLMSVYAVPLVDGWDEQVSDEILGGQRYTAKQTHGILRLAFRFNPKLLVCALGTPPPEVIEEAHGRGMLVGALAGKVTHAMKHKRAGVDLVIAQSYEAGGHTGDIGGMVLTPQIVDAVAPIPVLAAGGIGTGRQMAAALALGAKGVWCGSIWLATVESECSPLVRQKLVDATSDDTVKTRCFTGKPARYLKSTWIDEWEGSDAPPMLATPLQSIATGRYVERIDRAAMLPDARPNAGAGLLATKPAGQIIGMIDQVSTCRNVVTRMMTGCADAIADLETHFDSD